MTRSTHVLAIGLSQDSWDLFRSGVKGGLQSMHMGWSTTLNLAADCEEAVRMVAETPGLKLVYLPHKVCLGNGTLVEDCSRLAAALRAHPEQPWVILDPQVVHLKHIFHIVGLTVRVGVGVEHVADERFATDQHAARARQMA